MNPATKFYSENHMSPPVKPDPRELAIKAARLANHGQSHSREFDACFEQNNGKQVVLTILRTPSLKEDFPADLIAIWEGMYPDPQLSLGL